MFAHGILHPPVAARSRRPRIRFGPCPRILAAGGGLVQGAGRVEDSTVGTEKVNEAREIRRTCRAAGTGM